MDASTVVETPALLVEWEAAVLTSTPVGTCRVDGSPMLAEPAEIADDLAWLTSRCIRCGHEETRPGGRTARRRTPGVVRPAPAWFRSRAQARPPDHAERAAGGS
jgi:hypothetical protein